MVGVRPRWDRPTGPADEQEDEDDLEDEDEETSIDDLAPEADVEEFDRTFRITSQDESFLVNETPAIPRPWQGIPRAAIVYNLNFVYNETEDAWERQKKSKDGTSPVTVADSGVTTLSASANTFEPLDIPFDVTPDTLLPSLSIRPTGFSSTQLLQWSIDETVSGNGVQAVLSIDGFDDEWQLEIYNDTTITLEIHWKVLRVTG